MMRTLIWTATGLVIALWSALAWLAHGLISMGGSLVASNADIIPADPLLIEWASWLAAVGTGVGEWLVVVLWAIVSLVIAALGFVGTRLVPRLRTFLQNNGRKAY